MKKTAVFLATIIVLTWSMGVRAEAPGERNVRLSEPPTFGEVDVDGDSMITVTEFVAFIEARRTDVIPPKGFERRRQARFAEADADGDGVLSEEEFKNMPPKMIHQKTKLDDPEGLFTKIDTDRDGVLNEQEFDLLIDRLHHPRRYRGEEAPWAR